MRGKMMTLTFFPPLYTVYIKKLGQDLFGLQIPVTTEGFEM